MFNKATRNTVNNHISMIKKYYYGFRSYRCLPAQDTNYRSSSLTVKQARQLYRSSWFKKKILASYTTREEALAYEIYL
jgi:hypothetical protein